MTKYTKNDIGTMVCKYEELMDFAVERGYVHDYEAEEDDVEFWAIWEQAFEPDSEARLEYYTRLGTIMLWCDENLCDEDVVFGTNDDWDLVIKERD